MSGTALEEMLARHTVNRAQAYQGAAIMNAKQIGIGCVLAAFVALTGYAVDRYGYMAFFDFQALNAIQLQIFIDLSIALTFVRSGCGATPRRAGSRRFLTS